MTAPIPNYVHRARVATAGEVPPRAVPVHDGDTFFLRIDTGTYAGVRVDPVVKIRLKGIDTWELSQPPKGDEARAFTLAQLTGGRQVTVLTEKPLGGSDETLGRTVGQVWIGDDDLADLLRADGHEKTKT